MDEHRLGLRLRHDLDHVLCRGHAVRHHGCPGALRHLRLRAALAGADRRHPKQRHRRRDQSHAGQDPRRLRSAARLSLLHRRGHGRAGHDGGVQQRGGLCRRAGLLRGREQRPAVQPRRLRRRYVVVAQPWPHAGVCVIAEPDYLLIGGADFLGVPEWAELALVLWNLYDRCASRYTSALWPLGVELLQGQEARLGSEA